MFSNENDTTNTAFQASDRSQSKRREVATLQELGVCDPRHILVQP